MLHTFELILVLLCIVVALEALARRVAMPSPFLLLPAGILLGFIDRFPHVDLDPNLVLYIFLPPLVYIGAATGSWIEFRKNIRPIGLLSIGGVLFTTAAVACAAHAFIPDMGWPAAFVLGAVVSPPDEVAAISIARRLGIPKYLTTVLEGEGLVNDATALTVYKLAAAAVVTHSFSMMTGAYSFILVVVGETAWGLLVGWAILNLRRRLRDTSLEVSLSLLTPFVAYLPAERLGGSGVLAAVAAGLYVSYMNSHLVTATTRLQVRPVWEIIEFSFDGILFLVAGMQFHRILEPFGSMDHRLLLTYGVAASLLVIGVRFLWVYPATYLPRLLSAGLRRDYPAPSRQTVFLISWSGMRGAISLAAALAIPLLTDEGLPFPHRDLIIYLTFCVIVSTLILQGLSLPWLIRFLGLDRAGLKERAEAGHLEIEARRQAAQASLELLSARRKEEAYPQGLLDRLEEQYRYRDSQFRAHLDGDHDGAVQHGTHSFNAQTELIETERKVMLEMRDAGMIDDGILRRVEKDLDLQEMRLRQGITEWTLFADEDHEPVE